MFVFQVLEEFLSYSREMTHTDNRGMKMGDPYSVFTVDGIHVSRMTPDFNLGTLVYYPLFASVDLRCHGSDRCQAESGDGDQSGDVSNVS